MRTGHPVGFQDVHTHIVEAGALLTSQGYIDFASAQTVSLNFVGLYTITWFVRAVANVDIVTIAGWLPPFIDVLAAVLVYLVARRMFDPRIAMIALIFFAWDNNTILFGHEFRTQTIGTIFTLGAILAYLGSKRPGGKKTAFSAAAMLFLFAISTSSFVSDIFALVLFTVLVITPIFVPRMERIQGVTQYGLFVSFFGLYILYISTITYGSPSAVVSSIVILIREAFSKSTAPSVDVGQQVYGPVVLAFTYGFWLMFVVFLLLMIRWRTITKANSSTPVLWALLATFAAGVAFSAFSILNPGRAYAVGSIVIALVVAVGLVAIVKRSPEKSRKKMVGACAFLVVMFVAVAVAKFPVYIVEDVAPIRSHELIDEVPYWHFGAQDISSANFILVHCQGKSLHLDMLIAPYTLLAVYRNGLVPVRQSFDSNGRLLLSNIRAGDLILLRNSYGGNNYAFRNFLPPEASYRAFSQIYSDGDYILYLVDP